MAASVPVVPMDRGNNTTCTINLHGATIVSWRVNNQVMVWASFWGILRSLSPRPACRHEAVQRGGRPVVKIRHKGLVKLSDLSVQKQNCGFAACNSGRQTVWSGKLSRKYRTRRFADEISGLLEIIRGLKTRLLHEIWNHGFNFRNNSLSARNQCLTVGSQFEGEFRSSSRRSVKTRIT